MPEDQDFRLLIDDYRALIGFDAIARTFDMGKKLLSLKIWKEVCFDHDLGDPDPIRNGYKLIVHMLEELQFFPEIISLVTSNPVGRDNMIMAIERCGKYEPNLTNLIFTRKAS